jgi:hypothetical protein
MLLEDIVGVEGNVWRERDVNVEGSVWRERCECVIVERVLSEKLAVGGQVLS